MGSRDGNRLELFGTPSRCHGVPSLIVQSRPGGFVTQDCPVCGKPSAIRLDELPFLRCFSPGCGNDVKASQDRHGNYVYACQRCSTTERLADVVPSWKDHFPYRGFGIDQWD